MDTSIYNAKMKQIQAEIVFDELVNELSSNDINKPKIFSMCHYVDNQTMVIQYDKYVGILEYNADKENYAYVALGKNVSDDLSHKQLQLVDARFLQNDELFQNGVNYFVKFVRNKEPDYCEKIQGQQTNEFILEKIEEVWELAEEKNKAIIH